MCSESLRGCHPKIQWLLCDVEKQKQAIQWVRENTAKKGQKRLTCQTFQAYLNTELLKDAVLELTSGKATGAGGKRLPKGGISERTAARYLHRLGFELIYNKKGAYFDGHERADVVADRVRYLAEKKEQDRLTVRSMPSKEKIEEYLKLPRNNPTLRSSMMKVLATPTIHNVCNGEKREGKQANTL